MTEAREVRVGLHEEGVLDPAVSLEMEVVKAIMDRFSAMAFSKTICREYVRYGPGPLKSHTTMAMKLARMVLSTVRCQSRYKHISHSI